MNSRTQALLIGGLFGTALGALGGWLYYKANVEVDDEGAEALSAPSPGAVVKLALSLLGVLRLITG